MVGVIALENAVVVDPPHFLSGNLAAISDRYSYPEQGMARMWELTPFNVMENLGRGAHPGRSR